MAEGMEKDRARAETKAALAQSVGPIIVQIRNRRQVSIEDQWLRAHHVWHGVQSYTYYNSEFQHFVPAFRRSIERQVTRIVQQLIPSPQFFQVFPGNELDLQAGDRAQSNHRYMEWLLEHRVKVRRYVEQLARTFLLYTRCVSKTSVEIVDVPNIQFGRFVGSLRQIWPTTRAVDPFNFYVWPETINDIEQASIVVEDVMMPWSEYQDAVKLKIADEIDRNLLGDPVWPIHMTMRLDVSGLGTPSEVTGQSTQEGRKPKQAFVALSEVYMKGSGGSWAHLWLVWNLPDSPKVVRIHKSAYPRPPYRLGIARMLPNEHYTPGPAQDIEGLQILLNDQFNQGEESRAVATGPPVLVDPSLAKRADQYVFGYRRKWIAHKDGINMLEITDTSQSALRAAQFTLSLINDMGGQNPLTQGQPIRGLPRGSQAASTLINLASADIVEMAKVIEESVLTPTLQDLYNLTIAFVPPEQVTNIPGSEDFDPVAVSVADLWGNWHYKWMGATKFQDTQSQAAGMMNLLQNLLRAAPALQSQGWQVDYGTIFRVLWKDTLGERRLANVIRKMTPDEMAQTLQLMQAQAAATQSGKTAGSPPPGGPGPARTGSR